MLHHLLLLLMHPIYVLHLSCAQMGKWSLGHLVGTPMYTPCYSLWLRLQTVQNRVISLINLRSFNSKLWPESRAPQNFLPSRSDWPPRAPPSDSPKRALYNDFITSQKSNHLRVTFRGAIRTQLTSDLYMQLDYFIDHLWDTQKTVWEHRVTPLRLPPINGSYTQTWVFNFESEKM